MTDTALVDIIAIIRSCGSARQAQVVDRLAAARRACELAAAGASWDAAARQAGAEATRADATRSGPATDRGPSESRSSGVHVHRPPLSLMVRRMEGERGAVGRKGSGEGVR